jgi:hypothetical protein
MLWAQSGNKCALCKMPLVRPAIGADEASVVADECHIVSKKGEGPRHNPDYAEEKFDSYENLIVLCKVDHKMVDDQSETYSVEVLKTKKNEHEKWISLLGQEEKFLPVKIKRIKNNVPAYLVRVSTGEEVMQFQHGCLAMSPSYDAPKTQEEADLLAGVLGDLQDVGDMWGEIGAGEDLRMAFGLTSLIEDLERAGFWLFAGREVQVMTGGYSPDKEATWPVAIFQILRKDNPEIVTHPGTVAED